MSALTATKRAAMKLAVTERDATDLAAVTFAIRVAQPMLSPEQVLLLTFGTNRANRQWNLPPSLRTSTAKELEAIASHDRRRQRTVLERILVDGRIRHLEGRADTSYDRARGLRISWTPVITSAEQMIDFGLALLLDESERLGERFFRCQLPECREFFIAPAPKRQGQFRFKYCSEAHQKAADRARVGERVKRFRERQKERKQ